MVRLLWLSVGMCALALVVLATALYRVDAGSSENDRLFAQQSREAIIRNCEATEAHNDVMREIMNAVIRFNVEEGTPFSLRRAEEYRRIVKTKLAPVDCRFTN